MVRWCQSAGRGVTLHLLLGAGLGSRMAIMWVSIERGQSSASSLYPCEKSWILEWSDLPCHLVDDGLHLLIHAVSQLCLEQFIQIKLLILM